MAAIRWYTLGMGTNKGRFIKGHRASPATEFKPGQHWRPHGRHREEPWLREQYETKQRSASDIAKEVGITENGVLYWLHKHGIPRRTVSETRAVKAWGLPGMKNPMFGKCGPQCVNWKGGVTPLRQAVYSSIPWAHAVEIVWDRDGGVCTEPGCGVHETNRRRMHIHHDLDFHKHPQARCDPRFLRLVCSKCHGRIHAAWRKGGAANAR